MASLRPGATKALTPAENAHLYRQRHPESTTTSRTDFAKRRMEMRIWWDEQKSGPCADCGGTFGSECMDFHHARGPKLFTIAARRMLNKDKLLAEIAKCDLLCANCHRTRHKMGINFGKRNELGLGVGAKFVGFDMFP